MDHRPGEEKKGGGEGLEIVVGVEEVRNCYFY